MKPDRSNYEIWFIDFLDGNLSESDVELLTAFLKENPDLQEELSNLGNMKLEPADQDFKGKDRLFRSPGDVSDSQFDYLCIANLEKDITPGQRSELDEIISNDGERRKIYEIYQKLRLKPVAGRFKRKRTVRKITPAARIIRMAAYTLTAAASVTILIISFFSPNNLPEIPGNVISENVTIDTFLIESHSGFVRVAEAKIKTVELKPEPVVAAGEGKGSSDMASLAAASDSPIENPGHDIFERFEPVAMVSVIPAQRMIIQKSPLINDLRIYRPKYVPDFLEDNRSNVDRFLARIFHEKIMRDTIMPERPVERFELATAGITGINKLLGWEMALHKNTDESGELKSYVFTSGFLKFNAPARRIAKSL
jgi:hypothetical protein